MKKSAKVTLAKPQGRKEKQNGCSLRSLRRCEKNGFLHGFSARGLPAVLSRAVKAPATIGRTPYGAVGVA
jgi:hypothetical protein